MEQYILKSALVAEIERRITIYQKNFNKVDNKITRLSADGLIADGLIQGLKSLLAFLDTLEVKEVDLEKEYEEFVVDDPILNVFIQNDVMGMKVAKHFFELGLKAQNGE